MHCYKCKELTNFVFVFYNLYEKNSKVRNAFLKYALQDGIKGDQKGSSGGKLDRVESSGVLWGMW